MHLGDMRTTRELLSTNSLNRVELSPQLLKLGNGEKYVEALCKKLCLRDDTSDAARLNSETTRGE